MKRIIIINGIVAGVIVSVIMVSQLLLMNKGVVNMDSGMIIGYTSMVISLSMVFFGIKSYRDQHQNGAITFWKAFQIGILISIIATLMYAITWEIYYNTSATDFMEKYTEHYLNRLESKGATAAEMEAARQEMAASSEMYKNPIIRFGITIMEMLPVGILITLISAGLLRKREVLPA